MSNPWNKVVICDSYDATTGTPSGNVVEIQLADDEVKPVTIEEAELLVESKCVGAELTKARTILTAFKAKVAEGKTAEESK